MTAIPLYARPLDGYTASKELRIGGGQQVVLGLWMLFLLVRPVRLFPNGYPQIADFLLVFLLGLTCAVGGFRVPRRSISLLLTLGSLVLLTLMVNASWAALSGEWGRLVFSAFFAYNLFAFTQVFLLYQSLRIHFVRATAIALYAALVIQAVAIVVSGGVATARSVGLFENPNQLGYFALLAGCIIYVCALFLPTRNWLASSMPLCLMLVLFETCVSLSRGAIIGAGLLALGWLLTTRKTAGVLMLSSLTLFVGGGVAVVGSVIEKVEERFRDDRLGSTESQLGVRGYDRIFKNPELVLFGAGEGGRSGHFDSVHDGEMHSTLGTLLFSYGILGVLLFLLLHLQVLIGNWQAAAVTLTPVAAYSLSHYGLRQAEFWILIGILGTLKLDTQHPYHGR